MEYTGQVYFQGCTAAARAQTARATLAPGLRQPQLPWPEVEAFLEWLFGQVGLDVRDYRAAPLLRRLPACLRLLRVHDLREARDRLGRHPALVPSALSAFLLGVTDFYRDEAVFEQVQHQVLPGLLGRAPRIRIWSAACSDGPELYSVAMLLEEMGRLTRAELLGTDCRPDAIRRATAGIFSPDALRQLPPERASRHFMIAGAGRVQLSPRLRTAVRWRVADLLAGAMPGPWDLVLWRNMSIYLATPAADRMWKAIDAELRLGAYVVTGKADHPPSWLGWTRIAPCIYRKAGDRSDV